MEIYEQTNKFLEDCFHVLEAIIPSPVITEDAGELSLRYEGEHLEVAIIQKLARYISGLNASLLLLKNGYTQELGALFRTLDEFGEDIVFLSLPIFGEEYTKLHEDFLSSFFQEEFENDKNPIESKQKRPTIRRAKIASAISRSGLSSLNPSDAQNVYRTLSQVYSGYVHGSSVHVVEMVAGNPLRYYLRGMKGTTRQDEFLNNYWDYSYRGILSVMCAAKALGHEELAEKSLSYRDYFEKVTGDTGSGDPEELMKEIKKKRNA